MSHHTNAAPMNEAGQTRPATHAPSGKKTASHHQTLFPQPGKTTSVQKARQRHFIRTNGQPRPHLQHIGPTLASTFPPQLQVNGAETNNVPCLSGRGSRVVGIDHGIATPGFPLDHPSTTCPMHDRFGAGFAGNDDPTNPRGGARGASSRQLSPRFPAVASVA